MRFLFCALVMFPALSSAQMTEGDIWAKVIDRFEQAQPDLEQGWSWARTGRHCIDATAQSGRCESGEDLRLDQRADFQWSLDAQHWLQQFHYRVLARLATSEYPALETFEDDMFFSPANHWSTIPQKWYLAFSYPSEVMYEHTLIGIEDAAFSIAVIWRRVGDAWHHFNAATYFLTWVLALENTRGAPIIPESEAELLQDSLDVINAAHVGSAIASARDYAPRVCENYPPHRVAEIQWYCNRLIPTIDEAEALLDDARAMLNKDPCGTAYPCVVDGLDVHEFPGHAASYWLLSPDKTEGRTMGVVLFDLAYWYFHIARLADGDPETHQSLKDLGTTAAVTGNLWKWVDGIHYPLAKLVAREHERHH